jgi:polyisoprenoid-binding protein YceI
MKNTLIAGLVALSGSALAADWEIDTTHASANFTVKHLGVTNVNGTLGPVTGKFTTDDKDITKSKLEVTIDAKGINTNNQKRDDHLKSPDFFDVEKNPTVTFKSTKIEKISDSKLKFTGDLTMHGVTKPVSFEAELSPEVDHPMAEMMKMPGLKARAASGSLTLNREDWGLTWNMPMANSGFVVSKDVKVALEVELMKKPAAAAPAKAAPAKK